MHSFLRTRISTPNSLGQTVPHCDWYFHILLRNARYIVLRLRKKTSIHKYGHACICTILPAKSDSASCFVNKAIRDLESIDHLCINPICRLTHKRFIDMHYLKWCVQGNVLLNNCKQNMTSLSLLVGRTVTQAIFTLCIWDNLSCRC